MPVLLLVTLLTLAALPGAAAAPAEVTIDLTGEPVGTVEVEEGGRVTLHAASGDHDIVADDGAWSAGSIPEGEEAVLQFNQLGDYPFHCTIHENETGVIRVVAAESPDDPDEPADPDEPDEPAPNTPPTVQFAAPSDGSTVSGTVNVRVQATDAEDAPADLDVRVSVDDGAARALAHASGDAWAWTWDSTSVANGPVELDVIVTDSSGETARAMVRVQVENEEAPDSTDDEDDADDRDDSDDEKDASNAAPTIAFTAPAPGSPVRGKVNVEGTAADTDGDDVTVQIAVDDGPWREADGGREWRFVWDSDSVAPGEHVLRARASDGTDTSRVMELVVVVPEPGEDFDGPAPDPTPSPSAGATGWKNAVLDAGWAVLAFVALASAWAWASSRP